MVTRSEYNANYWRTDQFVTRSFSATGIYRRPVAMIGLVIKGITGIGVSLCFTIVKAVYDVVTKRKSIPSAIFNVGLSSILHGAFELVSEPLPANVNLPLTDGRNIRVPVQRFAECATQTLVDASIERWLSTYRIEALPSGLSVARAAVVNVSGARVRYEGEIDRASGTLTPLPEGGQTILRRIVLPETILRSNMLPTRELRGRVL